MARLGAAGDVLTGGFEEEARVSGEGCATSASRLFRFIHTSSFGHVSREAKSICKGKFSLSEKILTLGGSTHTLVRVRAC